MEDLVDAMEDEAVQIYTVNGEVQIRICASDPKPSPQLQPSRFISRLANTLGEKENTLTTCSTIVLRSIRRIIRSILHYVFVLANLVRELLLYTMSVVGTGGPVKRSNIILYYIGSVRLGFGC